MIEKCPKCGSRTIEREDYDNRRCEICGHTWTEEKVEK